MESLNIQLQPFFEWLLRTTLQASVLIVLILLVQLMLRGKLGIRWCYCLWLVLLIRMAIPWAPQSRVSMFNLIPQSAPQRYTEYAAEEVTYKSEPNVAETGTGQSAAVSTTRLPQDTSKAVPATPVTHREAADQLKPDSFGIAELLPLLWLTGALVLAVYVCAGNFHLWWLITRQRPLTDQDILDLLEDCKSQMGIRTILGIVVSDKVNSPALFGFIRPRLLLPAGMIETLSREELRYVFLHELAHLKRHDIYVGYLSSLLQVLHWFNPLVWLAFYRMRADRELACDALVLARLSSGGLARTQPSQASDYGRTIVSLLERFSRPKPLPAMAGILETKTQLKRRIKMIAQFKKNSYRWSPLAVILIILLAGVVLPDAPRERAFAKSSPGITLRQVRMESGGFMSLSPDGKYLCDIDWNTGNLVIRELATGNIRPLTDKGNWEQFAGFATISTISRDSKKVVFLWYNHERQCFDLREIGLDGSGDRVVRRFLEKDQEMEWLEPAAWSPDGKQILVRFSRKGEHNQIAWVSTADGSVRTVKVLNESWPGKMDVSPNGRYIVYDLPQEEETSRRDIFAFDIEKNREVPLVQHPADDKFMGWTPDSRHIFFTSNRMGSWDGWILPVARGEPSGLPELVKASMGDVSPIGFTPGGSFYYAPAYGPHGVYTAALDLQTGKVLSSPKPVRHTGIEGLPDWSPDGRYLAYCTRPRGEKSQIIHIRSVETGQERQLDAKLPYFHWLRWSPDGRSILVGGLEEKNLRNVVYKVDILTGERTVVLRTETGMIPGAALSPDGKALVYSHWDGAARSAKFMVRDLETSHEEQLVRAAYGPHPYLGWTLSPDGKRLAFILEFPGTRTLNTISITGGQPKELLRMKGEEVLDVAWTRDSQNVLFMRGKALWRIPAEGGEPRKLWTWKKGHLSFDGIRVHPDGRNLAFGVREVRSEVWVMENFLPEAPVTKPEPTTTVRRIGYDWRGPFASLSPDGKYMSDRDWDTGNLVIYELATGKSRTLLSRDSHTPGYPMVSAISPDSKEVAYLWHDPNTKASSLHVIGLDGAGHRILCKRKWPMPRDWSADGQKILATVIENNVAQMVWISALEGSIQHIVDVSLGYLGKVDISPDGLFIAYDRPRGEGPLKRDIFLFDLHENRELSIINHPADDRFLGWTPDGRHIFFSSDRTGTWDAWLLPVAGGEPQGFPKLARSGIGNITPIGFTPQGSYYYGHEQTLQDVFVSKLDLETGEFLSEPMPVRQSGATTCHDWSPDGRYLAYCERRSDDSQVVHIRTLATGRERTLSGNLPYIRWLRWFPDMRSIITDGYKRGDSQGVISKIDVQTGERTDLARSQTDVLVRPEMSPDGKTLFFECSNDPKSKTSHLIARDLESGREKELFRVESPARLTNRALSPDGQRLVISIIPDQTRPLAPVLKILPAAGGKPRELIKFDKSENLRGAGVAWTPDSENVLFWKWRFEADKELELWRISAEGGAAKKLCSRKAFGHMRVHPDGQRVAFYDRSTTRELWVMENFLPAMGK